MAVAFDANATADVTANAVTSITTSNLTVGSGSNRALLVQIGWSGTVTSPTVQWDFLGTPQSAAQVPNAGATNTERAEIWGLVNPTSGAKQLKVAWTTSRDVVVNQLSYTNVDQTGGATSFPHGVGAAVTSTGATQTVVTVTSATGNATVAVMNTTGTPSAPTQTQTFLDATPANASVAGARAAGAASVAFGWTTDLTHPVAGAGCDIAASVAGAASPTNGGTGWVQWSYAFPVSLRTHVEGIRINLIGKDQFFGAPGEPPHYDYPNPLFRPLPIGCRGFIDGSETWTWGKDTFFGGPGQPPANHDWPVPKGYPFPVEDRGYMDGSETWTWGKDQFFGAPGEAPTYDYPNPQVKTVPIAAKGVTEESRTWLWGKDTFFGAPGQPPTYDYPNPVTALRKSIDLLTWLVNLQETTLSFVFVQPPFYLNDWPNPTIAGRAVDLRTWLQSPQSPVLNSGAVPFSLKDWPNPLISGKVVDLKSILVDLLQTTLAIIPSPPFYTLDWPNPKGYAYPVELRTFIDKLKVLAGKDQFFGAPGQAPVHDTSNPVIRGPVSNLHAYVLDLLSNTLGVFPHPFYLRDWPNPVSSAFPTAMRGAVQSVDVNLIGKDQFFGAPGEPPTNRDWPNPKGYPFPTELRTSVKSGTYLIGQDKFFGAAGMGPHYDLSNPVGVRSLLKNYGALVAGSTGRIPPLPPLPPPNIYNLPWDNPIRARYSVSLLTWLIDLRSTTLRPSKLPRIVKVAHIVNELYLATEVSIESVLLETIGAENFQATSSGDDTQVETDVQDSSYSNSEIDDDEDLESQ